MVLAMIAATLGTTANAFKLLLEVRLLKVAGVVASLVLVGVFAFGAVLNSILSETHLSRTGFGWLTTLLLVGIWFWSVDTD